MRHLAVDEDGQRRCLLCGLSYDRKALLRRLRDGILARHRPPSLNELRVRAEGCDVPFEPGELV